MDELRSAASPNIEKMLGRVAAPIVVDLVGLSHQFYVEHAAMLGKSKKIVIGGTLAGSADVGGADFYCLVDGCLFDFKAIRPATITTQHLRQLAGYGLLDYDDTLKIRRFAVSLLRHGHTEYFDIERDLLPVGDFTSLRSAFRDQLQRIKSKRKKRRT